MRTLYDKRKKEREKRKLNSERFLLYMETKCTRLQYAIYWKKDPFSFVFEHI